LAAAGPAGVDPVDVAEDVAACGAAAQVVFGEVWRDMLLELADEVAEYPFLFFG